MSPREKIYSLKYLKYRAVGHTDDIKNQKGGSHIFSFRSPNPPPCQGLDIENDQNPFIKFRGGGPFLAGGGIKNDK